METHVKFVKIRSKPLLISLANFFENLKYLKLIPSIMSPVGLIYGSIWLLIAFLSIFKKTNKILN